MTLALIALIMFLVAPIFIGAALAWLRIRAEQSVAAAPGSHGPERARDAGRRALPPAA